MFHEAGLYRGFFGGLAQFNGGTVSPGTWAHLALVRDSGTATFYVNGIAVDSRTNIPNAATAGFTIATFPEYEAQPSLAFFNGTIDEVRVFTFAAGQFSTNDLLLNLQRVATLPATSINPPHLTLNGSVNPAGLPTSVWFEWGSTTNYGNVTPAQPLGSGTGNTNFNQGLTNLPLGLTHHFRAVASNSLGIAYGTNRSHTTHLFALTTTTLPGLTLGAAAWGDSDNDGRLDMLLTGHTGSNVLADIWRNTVGGFIQSFAGLTGVTGDLWPAAAAWGDANNDGWLDVLLAGSTNGNFYDAATELWANTHPGFVRSNIFIGSLPQAVSGTVEWGDYNSDGRLDFLLAGYDDASGYHGDLWGNTPAGFSKVNAQLPSFEYGSADWGDFDNDGDLDLLVVGRLAGAQVLRQNGGNFSSLAIGLPELIFGSAAWGDYDNDGRLDFLITGSESNVPFSQLWRNTGTTFTNVPVAGLPGVSFSSVAWGDYDNDGRLDFLITGTTNGNFTGAISEVWRNTGTGFAKHDGQLPGIMQGSAAWGDYDNDGRLDIALLGTTAIGVRTTQVFRNLTPLTNSPPSAPTGLNLVMTNGMALLAWNAAADAQTPSSGLTYNLRAGSTPGGTDLISPQAAANGFRRLPGMGNAQMRRFAPGNTLRPGQMVYWSVQAVDTSLAGGPFGTEHSFISPPFVETVSGGILDAASAFLSGRASLDASHAWFEWGPTTNYGNTTPPQALDSGTGYTNFSHLLTGLVCGVTYHFRAIASNSLAVVAGTGRSVTGIANSNGLLNFNAGLPSGTAVYGTARVEDGILKLTDAVNGQTGSFFSWPVEQSIIISQFEASFQVRIADSTCCAPRPADGFSFVVAGDVPNTAFGEEGAGTGLIISFDTWDNGGSDTAPAIEVIWNETTLAVVSMAEPREGGRAPVTDIPYDPMTGQPMTLSTAGFPSGEFVPVHLKLDSDGTVDVSYKSVLVLQNVPIPGFTSIANARFGLGARTAGANATHWIDNLQLPGLPGCPPPAPLLRITPAGPGNASLSWTPDVPGWKLQEIANLATTNWINSASGTTNNIAVSVTNGVRYYRLIKSAP